jgi:hypothetical protein
MDGNRMQKLFVKGWLGSVPLVDTLGPSPSLLWTPQCHSPFHTFSLALPKQNSKTDLLAGYGGKASSKDYDFSRAKSNGGRGRESATSHSFRNGRRHLQKSSHGIAGWTLI